MITMSIAPCAIPKNKSATTQIILERSYGNNLLTTHKMINWVMGKKNKSACFADAFELFTI
jgi:hypothetical protein